MHNETYQMATIYSLCRINPIFFVEFKQRFNVAIFQRIMVFLRIDQAYWSFVSVFSPHFPNPRPNYIPSFLLPRHPFCSCKKPDNLAKWLSN